MFVKLDLCKVFNTLDRQALLHAVHEELPALAPWASWCYRAGRDLNTAPKGSLLQRDAVEYWVLRWKRMQLSAGCCVGDGCC